MNSFLAIETPAQLEELAGLAGLPTLDPQVFRQHAPDVHCILRQSGCLTACASLWWRQTPFYPGQRLGLIGHYAAEDADSARLLLDYACQRLADQGCTMAIAPIDGNTWRRYRLLSDRGSEPIFFLELDNPDRWCEDFENAGFGSIAHYSSALATNLTLPDLRLERVAERLEVEVRSIDLERFEQELDAIYDLSIVSFRQNFLYSAIDRAEFVSQYGQLKSFVQPDLVLMAEQNGKLVGFVFAVPDLLQAKRGERIDTVIIKTVAVLPGRKYAGLGNLLVARVQAVAHELGFDRAIHALMHDDNNSRNLSRRYARSIRRYTLYGKVL